ncbi:MAG: hypothetical protein IJE63_05460, partial [Clostridia bacterium]|nr:hypothetical protein [Clostridia bacterium]
KELAEALAEAEAFVANKACYDGQQKEVEDRLVAILVKIGVREASVPEEPSTFFTNLSLWLFDNYGPNGFSEMPLLTIVNLFKAVGSLLGIE